jgi:hypothetical protein
MGVSTMNGGMLLVVMPFAAYSSATVLVKAGVDVEKIKNYLLQSRERLLPATHR